MSCIQVTSCHPAYNITNICPSRHAPSMVCIACQSHKASLKVSTGSSIYKYTRLCKSSLNLSTAASRYRCAPICSFGGKGKSENGNEDSPWKALEKAMGGLKKEQSLEDVLRQQIQKQEYYDDGGSGRSPPGGSGDGSGGSEDEGISGILDELLQVILATIGFIFLYIYILEGEEITKLAKDYIKFLFGAQKSNRLKNAMYEWGSFYQSLMRKNEIEPDWLEHEILNTTTWWDSPEKYKRILRAYLESKSND